MKCIVVAMVIFVFCSGLLALSFEQIDELSDNGEFRQALTMLENWLQTAESASQEAEILWRMARMQMQLIDIRRDTGASRAELLEGYQIGIDYAARAIEADPGNHLGYFWRSALTGRYGQSRGILDSLNLARPMREDLERAVTVRPGHDDSWKVLAMLYNQVPGVISFGDKDAAVSLARKSVDLRIVEDHFDNFYELALILADRGWNARRRVSRLQRKQRSRAAADNLLDKAMYYEAAVDFSAIPVYADRPLVEMSDEEEAIALLQWLSRQLSALDRPRAGHLRLQRDVETALLQF